VDELKKLLGDALFAQVEEKLGGKQLFLHDKDHKVAVVSDGSWFPKAKWDEVNTTKKALEDQITERDKQLADLKKAVVGDTELQDKIKTLQEANKEAKQKADEQTALLRKGLAVKEHLMNSGVSDAEARDLLAMRFDVSKIELDADGKIKGFDELLKPIKENKTLSAMFGKEVVAGRTPADNPPPGTFFSREEVKAMSQEQVTANLDKVNKSMEQWK
jgi:hypothetical protein